MRAALVAALLMMTTPAMADSDNGYTDMITDAISKVLPDVERFEAAAGLMHVCHEKFLSVQLMTLSQATVQADVETYYSHIAYDKRLQFDQVTIDRGVTSFIIGYSAGFREAASNYAKSMSTEQQANLCASGKTMALDMLKPE